MTRAEQITSKITESTRFMSLSGQVAPWSYATIEQIIEFAEMIASVEEETGFHFSRYPEIWSSSRDELVAMAKRLNRKSNGRKQYKTLVNRYGEQAAKNIISR